MHDMIDDDQQLRELLTKEQLKALACLRVKALSMRCRSARDSAAMTAGNLLPLFIKERGVRWGRREAQRILTLLVGSQPDKRNFRRAVKKFIDLFSVSE